MEKDLPVAALGAVLPTAALGDRLLS